MASQAESESRAGAGRNRLPSRKAREAAENGNLEEPPAQNTGKKQKRKRTDIENEGPGGAVAVVNDIHRMLSLDQQLPRTRRQSEFTFETLSSNRTSQRASNVINLTANRDGIPAPKTASPRKAATPAKVAGGQRVTPVLPANKNRLTKEAAARLAAMRNPYNNTPSKPSSSRKASGYGMFATPAPTAGPSRLQPATASGSGNHQDSATKGNYDSDDRSEPPPPQRKPPTPSPGACAPGPHSNEAASTQSSQKGKERAHDTRDITHVSITETGRARGIGQISTSRIDTRDPEGTVYSDDEEVYEDYDSHPRDAALAQAYGITAPNPRAVAAHAQDFDDEELDEMAADPEAAMDEEDERFDARPAADHFEEQDAIEQVQQAPSIPVRHSPAVNSQRQVVRFHEDHNRTRERRQVIPTHRAAEEAEQPVRRRAQRTTEPARKKPRASDYDPEAKQVLARAITVFKARLTLDDAYPDNMQGRTWAKQAWEHAAEDFEAPDLEPDDEAIPLITRYSWHLRGEIKTAARAAVQGTYGFKSATFKNPLVIAHNENVAKMLLHERAYKYEDPARREGLYEGDIIQTIINRVYYKDPEDDGVVHDEAYRPFPFAGVALVLTAVECAINEWSTGLWQNVQFDEKYKAIYKSHLIDIKRFHAASGDDDIMREICTTISENGRFNAKVPVFTPVEVVGTLSNDEAARAIAAYRRRQEERRHQANL